MEDRLGPLQRNYSAVWKEFGSLPLTQDPGYLQIANISIGSPPQRVEVAVDLFKTVRGPGVSIVNLTYGCVPISTDDYYANDQQQTGECKQSGFDSSASDTFDGLPETFQNGSVTVMIAREHFNIGGISFQNVTFGLVTEYKVPVENAPLGGYLSFYPDILSDGLLPSIWYSIIKELDLPILTLWSNRSMECTAENLSGCEGVSSRITLGALDIEMCPGVWAYADQIQNLTSLTGFEFHVDSATFLLEDEPTVDQILSLEECENLNETAVIFPGYFPMRVPGALLDLIQSATNASYDENEKKDFVDCGLRDVHGLVTLRIGQLAHPLHLTGGDLIEYDNSTGKCYLEVERSSKNTFEDISNTHPSIVLSQRFLNNHCLAYNFDLKQFAFSSMPPDESDREYGIRAFDYP